MNLSRNTIIAVVIGVVIVVGIGYLVFVRPSTAASGPGVAGSAPASPAEATFVQLASQLEPLGFDTGILTDPRFESLVDIHTAIVPEQTGRQDPFAPLGR